MIAWRLIVMFADASLDDVSSTSVIQAGKRPPEAHRVKVDQRALLIVCIGIIFQLLALANVDPLAQDDE
jgi:hypothetical protein